MTTLPLGSVIVAHQVAVRELHSARPNAPVVPHRARSSRVLRSTRTATATALHRAAARIAPA
jgi:hypothetical protein